MVGSRKQPLSESISILALRQHWRPFSVPFFISSHRAWLVATAIGEEDEKGGEGIEGEGIERGRRGKGIERRGRNGE